MTFRYGSVCSGIEAASVAWHPLGWRASFLSEIEAFPRAVLSHHYPETPLHGDFTTIRAGEYDSIDLLVGGTPCQSFSVAGLRGGLDDPRGNLALGFLQLARRTRARWVVWENVPGVLSSNGGRDFGAILGGLAELGYGWAYRVLDAQFFGVAQRRRRVFVVGYLGDWRRAAAVLFERHSLSGHPAPRREKGKAAPTTPSRSSAGGGLGTDFDCDGGLISHVPLIRPALKARDAKGPSSDGDGDGDGAPLIAHALRGEGFDASEDGTGRGTPIVPVCVHSDAIGRDGSAMTPSPDAEGRIRLRDAGMGVLNDGTSYNLTTGQPHAVAFSITPSNSNRDYNAREVDKAQALTAGGNRPSARGGDLVAFSAKDHGADAMNDLSPTLRAGGHSKSHANAGVMPAVALQTIGPQPSESAVRRLTPRECERLQGFPDDYSLIPWRKGMAPDGPRYKALGNSMAVPVMAWIGRRIQAVETITAVANQNLPHPDRIAS